MVDDDLILFTQLEDFHGHKLGCGGVVVDLRICFEQILSQVKLQVPIDTSSSSVNRPVSIPQSVVH